MSFPARFKGKCDRCGAEIAVGQFITWNRKLKGHAWHTNCSDPWARPSSDDTSSDSAVADASAAAAIADGYGADADAAPVAAPAAAAPVSDALAPLAALLLPHLDGKIKAAIDHIDLGGMREMLDAKLAELEAVYTHRIVIDKTPVGGDVITLSGVHKEFSKLLELARLRIWALLHGPSQSGKSTAARQVAEALGLPYYYISLTPGTFESRLFGFVDAAGKYHETGFRKAYENGGIFLIDEIANASDNLLTSLNSALINEVASFPDGMIAKHPDFICVATDNTVGLGGNRKYAERRALSAAVRARFAFLEWGYDKSLERSLVKAINPNATAWLEWVWAVREDAAQTAPAFDLTPRASMDGARLLGAGWKVEDVAHVVAWKGFDPDTVAKLLGRHPYPHNDMTISADASAAA